MFKKILQKRASGSSAILENPALNPDCREFEINNWALSRFVCDRLVPVVDVHPFPLNEMMLMSAAVCRLKPTHIFEWGTHFGKSARIFYETTRAFAIDTEIHSIDLPDESDHIEHPGHERGSMVKGLNGVSLHVGDGLDTALELCRRIPREQMSALFFVDGDHAYISVKRELLGIIEHVPGASILLHDTFKQSEEAGYNIGPGKAIDEVLTSYPVTFKRYTQNLGLPGMTLLWHQGSGA